MDWQIDERFGGWTLWSMRGDLTGIWIWVATRNNADGTPGLPVGGGLRSRAEAIKVAEEFFGQEVGC